MTQQPTGQSHRYFPELTATIDQFSRMIDALGQLGFRPQEGTAELRDFLGQAVSQQMHDLTQQRIGYEKGYKDCLMDTLERRAGVTTE